MRLLKTLLFTVVATTSIVASSATALVTVTATSSVDFLPSVGDTFYVDILVSWDGAGSLTGIFTSHTWDSSRIELIGAVYPVNPSFETNPLPFKGGSYDPQLVRFGTIAGGIAGDDLTSTARTVQYVSPGGNPLNGTTSAKNNELITRLTFQVVGVGDGFLEVDGVILPGDGVIGDSFVFVNNFVAPDVCGDGFITAGEVCDDGGTISDDGCDATCQVEPGWTCEGEPSICTEVTAVPMLSPLGVGMIGGLLMIAAVRRLRANASPS